MASEVGFAARLKIENNPRGSICTTIMELGPKRPSLLWLWDPNSIIGVYMDPLGIASRSQIPRGYPLLYVMKRVSSLKTSRNLHNLHSALQEVLHHTRVARWKETDNAVDTAVEDQ